MALATEEEWENDPELRAMRAEFVASFAERRAGLERLAPELARAGAPGSPAFEKVLSEILHYAHKLAGAAETYGFPALSRAGAAFEDWCDRGAAEPARRDARVASEGALLIAELLAQAQQAGKDVPARAGDPRLASLEKR